MTPRPDLCPWPGCTSRSEVPLTPEELERRYLLLQSARRLRDLLESRATPSLVVEGDLVPLQKSWIWAILAPLIPGEIERLERAALEGVSRD